MTGDDIRDQLRPIVGRQVYADGPNGEVDPGALVRDLLPVVQRIARDTAADELDTAAGYWDRPNIRTIAADLRERAIALRNHTEETHRGD